jgi:hypothetical protein
VYVGIMGVLLMTLRILSPASTDNLKLGIMEKFNPNVIVPNSKISPILYIFNHYTIYCEFI